MKKPIREYDRFILRLPDGLREKLSLRATAKGSSMNAEAVQILTDALEEPDTIAEKAMAQELQRLQVEIDETARLLHNLSDRRHRLRNALSEAELAKHVNTIVRNGSDRADT